MPIAHKKNLPNGMVNDKGIKVTGKFVGKRGHRSLGSKPKTPGKLEVGPLKKGGNFANNHYPSHIRNRG